MASEAHGCGEHGGLGRDSWTELESPQPQRNFSLAKSVTGLLLRAFQIAEPQRGVVCNPRLALNFTISENPEHFWPPVSCPEGSMWDPRPGRDQLPPVDSFMRGLWEPGPFNTRDLSFWFLASSQIGKAAFFCFCFSFPLYLWL